MSQTRKTDPNQLTHHIAVPGPKHQVTGQPSVQIIGGLTKREWFATQILQGLVGNSANHNLLSEKVRAAIGAADELVKQLNSHAEEQDRVSQILQDAPDKQEN